MSNSSSNNPLPGLFSSPSDVSEIVGKKAEPTKLIPNMSIGTGTPTQRLETQKQGPGQTNIVRPDVRLSNAGKGGQGLLRLTTVTDASNDVDNTPETRVTGRRLN